MTDDPQPAHCTARVGTVLRGKWRIDSLIGVGGMAAVYEATHRIGRRCAIKILHPEIAVSKELRARFEQEALAVNQLGHPAAVNVLDIDTSEDGSPFLVMELLDGESLGKRAHGSGGIEERELLRVVSTVLEVLDVAHGLGIVHRDIKPDSSNSPFLMIAVIGSFAVAVCLAAVFFVVRSRDSAEDTRESANEETSQEDKASGSSRTMATSSITGTPSTPSTPSTTAEPPSTRRPAPNGKYRLLVKDGKYPFCVTSKLRHAYPVRTNDEGAKACIGTPDGPIPIDDLKAYHPSELQW
ncbi:serine/threonine-protein kinase [Sorangium sp. So ce281]|uniref:serine/threonine protein kinase n=1 Tax=unclassified Sorangium TaxID=2621164 RepID=UPI003F63163F